MACVFASHAHAALQVIGDWENSGNADPGVASDYWLDWNNGGSQAYAASLPDRYSFSNTTGVTLGSTAIHVDASGYMQDLSIKLQDNPTDPVANHPSLMPAFFSNRALAIDVTYPAQNATGGFQEIYGVALNAAGYGFTEQGSSNPLPGTNVGYGNGQGGALATPDHTFTLVINYGSHLDVNGGPIITSGPNMATFAEFIFATNGDSAHPDFYFDNARLFTPGDMNNDGVVDSTDVSAMISALSDVQDYAGSIPGFTLSDVRAIGDVNGDGHFDNFDLQALIGQIANGGVSNAPNTSVVPEPTSLVLFCFAIAGLLFISPLAGTCGADRR
ncbi:MAG TPA: dockerin type I domain-containing protein [Pirellulales bacterium]